MKRTINLKLLTALFFSILIGMGCSKKIDEFGNINTDPGKPSQPIPSALLANVTSGLGNWIFDGNYYRNTSVPAMYAQYMSQTQYTEESRYLAVNYNWDIYYSGLSNATGLGRGNLMDLQTIINYNTDESTKEKAISFGSNNNQIAVARILKAYLFWIITDQYGDIPYTGTLEGESSVPYTSQKDVYTDLLKELTEAVAQFDAGSMPTGDLLYMGNKTQWIKFANSIRLLMALRMSVVDPTTGSAQFKSALAAGVIEDNVDNAVINYSGGPFPNPFYEYYNIIQRQDISPSEFFVNKLKSTGDDRLGMFASTEVGFPYGFTRSDAIDWSDDHSNWAYVMSADYFNNDKSPMYLITAAHIWLARAEAANLGWTSEVTATDYQTGIQASWEQWGVYNAVDFTAYMANPAISLATPGNVEEKIITQRWIAFYPDGKQGWSVWRKTGYPVLTPAPGTNTGIVQRYPYGTNEINLNPDNYKDAAAKYTVDGKPNSMFAKLWWAKP
jgi:hypothetical protein